MAGIRSLVVASLLLTQPPSLVTADEASGPQSDLVRDLMDLVVRASELVVEEGLEVACESFQEPGPWYQGETYVFVLDMEGHTLCHPSRPELEGQNILDLQDPVGKPIVRSFIRELDQSEDGWAHYLWPRPGQLTHIWKTSYVRRVAGPEGGYIVGSGLYEIEMERFFITEQVRDAVRLIQSRGEAAFDILRDPASGFLFYDAYVFVVDERGVMRVNVASPELEGTDVSALRDAEGKLIFEQMRAKLDREESAWVDYRWPRPGEETPILKSSYIHRVDLEGAALIVGAGVYPD